MEQTGAARECTSLLARLAVSTGALLTGVTASNPESTGRHRCRPVLKNRLLTTCGAEPRIYTPYPLRATSIAKLNGETRVYHAGGSNSI